MVFQQPGEKWCRQADFIYIEQYSGGTFHKASEANYGRRYRYQKC